MRIRSSARILALVAALSAGAWAQTNVKVIPSMFENLQAPSRTLLPFTWETGRTQILYRTGALASGGGVILGLDFRKDSSTTSYPAMNRDLVIEGYMTPVTPATMSTSFAANRGTGTPTELFRGVANLPALAPAPTPPAPFGVNLMFSRPLPFTLAQGNLLFEFICNGPGTARNNYYFDGEFMSTRPGGRSFLIGMYCEGRNQEVFKCGPDDSTWVLGGRAEVGWGPGGTQPTSIIAFLGDRTDRWGPVPLPFDLAPLGGIGAGPDPCRFYTNWLASVAIPLNQTGQFGPIPNDPIYQGVTLFIQGLAPVQRANPLNLIMGTAYGVTIGSSLPPVGDLNLVYLENNLVGTTGKFGSTSGFTGPVTRFNGAFN